MRVFRSILSLCLVAFAIPAYADGPAVGSEINLPPKMTWVSLDSQSVMYVQAVSIAHMLEKNYQMDTRIIPVRNGISRLIPLVTDRADVMITGTDGYIAQEGAFIYAKKGFGPQKVRLLITNEIQPGNGMAVAADAGIETVEDIRGKRVAVIQGSAGGNKIIEATLAFGGLGWSDVVVIPVPTAIAAHEAIVNFQADATQANVISGTVERWASSSRGLHWPPLAHDDHEGWERLLSVTPYTKKAVICKGIGISKGTCKDLQGYGYPSWLSMADLTHSEAYGLIKAITLAAGQIEINAPQAYGYALEDQTVVNTIPWHQGVVQLFQEAGLWTEQAQQNNDRLIRRQEVLSEAWIEMVSLADGFSEDEFGSMWSEVRAKHLRKADLPIVYHDAYKVF